MEGIEQSKKIKEGHYIEWFLPFFYLLSQYKLGPITYGEIGLIIVALFVLRSDHYKFSIDIEFRPFLIFLGYVVFRDVIRMALLPDNVQIQIDRMIEYLVIYTMVIIVCSNSFDEATLFKSWKIAGTIYIFGMIYHIVQLYIFHQTVFPISIIPGYKLRPDALVDSTRPSSFFAEPASFVSAMMPLEFISLRRKNYLWAGMSTLSVLLSTSTVGVILSAVLWLFFLLTTEMEWRYKVRILIIAAGLVFVFFSGGVFTASLEKMNEVLKGGSTVGSRIYAGVDVLKTLPAISWVFGTDYNSVNTYIGDYSYLFSPGSMAILYYHHGGVFLNTLADLIFSYGVVGVCLFLNPLFKYLQRRDYKAKGYVIMLFVAMFGQTLLLNTTYFMVLIILILYGKKSSLSELKA